MKNLVLLRGLMAALLLGLHTSAVYSQSPDEMRMQAFAQGKANNCISVALIKAAIQRYGVGQVFDTLHTDGQVRVTLRDHTALTLTDAERQQAADWAKFKQPAGVTMPAGERAALVSYANFCYAVMAKYIETQKLYGCTNEATNRIDSSAALGSYHTALKRLTKRSICSDNAYRHLGLLATDATAGGHEYDPKRDFSTQTAVVAYSDNHAVFVLGKQYDDHGTWKPLTKEANADDITFKPKWFFELK
ncbi:hypothetical protein ACFP2F_11035 [Hymenobacter artigasi]|uniref:Peptidase C39-like domain-containing protein n=1 Tax=Hymenobacter artigasi TaxID=2719616 RepID=A0ABX1HIU3_9BACT|nr:hypothetical protein [Hymenobacter artigasi]NKI90193.1 hypothetical protein [Hymenobacter artigasi]